MQRTLESLQDRIIKSFELLDFKSGESFYYLKVKAVIVDDRVLQIKEYGPFDSYFLKSPECRDIFIYQCRNVLSSYGERPGASKKSLRFFSSKRDQ